jgi:transposase-like protein
VSVIESFFVTLRCPKCRVVEFVGLSRLCDKSRYDCAVCGHSFNLLSPPYKAELESEWRLASMATRELTRSQENNAVLHHLET